MPADQCGGHDHRKSGSPIKIARPEDQPKPSRVRQSPRLNFALIVERRKRGFLTVCTEWRLGAKLLLWCGVNPIIERETRRSARIGRFGPNYVSFQCIYDYCGPQAPSTIPLLARLEFSLVVIVKIRSSCSRIEFLRGTATIMRSLVFAIRRKAEDGDFAVRADAKDQ